MIQMEIHPGEGGEDAALFAEELTKAVSKYSGRKAVFENGSWRLERL